MGYIKMSYSRIVGSMIMCSVLLCSSGAVVAKSGGAAGVAGDNDQTAVPANTEGVAPDNSVGAVPAKDVQQLDKKLQTEPEQNKTQ